MMRLRWRWRNGNHLIMSIATRESMRHRGVTVRFINGGIGAYQREC